MMGVAAVSLGDFENRNFFTISTSVNILNMFYLSMIFEITSLLLKSINHRLKIWTNFDTY